MAKQRADLLLVQHHLVESRTQAKKLIMAGKVRVGADHMVRSASETWPEDTVFTIEQPSPYVSRGAAKLLPALDSYAPDLTGKLGLDIGASTGGFTDLMLQRGARKVYAVDAGHGQLHFKLRQDDRVICLEKTNARYLSQAEIPELADILTMDVSFISVTKILPAVAPLLEADFTAFILVKPQFEARRQDVGKGGVVKDPAVRQGCLDKVCAFAEQELGWKLLDALPSPITGPKGNQETIAVFRRS